MDCEPSSSSSKKGKSKPMFWTEEHDVLMCHEVLLIELHNQKPGSRERGQALENIAQDLNCITEINFNVTKRSVRDRLNFMIENFKKEERQRERASGIDVEETELDQLLREIIEKQHEANLYHEKVAVDKKDAFENEKANAEEQRKRAMESLEETTRRRSEVADAAFDDSDDFSPPKRTRRTGNDTMTYLREKCQQEFELKKQELEAKKEESKMLKNLILQPNNPGPNAAMQQQLAQMQQLLYAQQQQQQLLLDLLKKILQPN